MKFDDLTIEQKAAVTEKGNVVVSAAAGSGKTAVLVERILNEITRKENPLSIDRLLIVTFTVAAAGEMRARLQKRLFEYCNENPDDEDAAKQKMLLGSAKISTIDSFCIELLRNNFHKSGVSPDFKIADENDLIKVKEEVLSKVLEKYFEEKDENFYALLEGLGSIYDESKLSEAVINIYNKIQCLPFPEKWLLEISRRFEEDKFPLWKEKSIYFAKELLKRALNYLKGCENYFIRDVSVRNAYESTINVTSEGIEKLILDADVYDFDAFYRELSAFSFESFKGVRGMTDNENADGVKTLNSLAKDALLKAKKLIYADEKTMEQHYNNSAKLVLLLLKITYEFSVQLKSVLIEKGTLSFSDVSHLAFELICDYKDGKIVLKDGAEAFTKEYDEILVDEYQDVNDLQNTFFYFLSSRGEKLFTVGDVKQSIYGFRGSNPQNFLDRKNKAKDYKISLEKEAKSILLKSNFRSRKGVCDYINYIFDRLMTEELSGINYLEGERLEAEANFPDNNFPCAEFHLVDTLGQKENEAEAEYIGDYILSVMEKGELVTDKNTKELRPVKFSDFAIIVRALKNSGEYLVNALRSKGIPVTYTKKEFLSSKEISTIISLLKVIDNPTNDIELLSVMMSHMFNFLPDDMVSIRCQDRKASLYSATVLAAEKGNDKCKNFLKVLGDMRKLSIVLPLSSLINKLYDMTDYVSIVSTMNDSVARKANLSTLIDYARMFEENGNYGLGAFVEYLLKMGDERAKGATLTMGNDAVKIINIHKSKGLQFPICILGFTASSFNTSDLKDTLIIDYNEGISLKHYDDEEGNVASLDRQILSFYAKDNMLKEELRLLYVAATRAEEKLVITAAKKNAQGYLEKTAVKLEGAMGRIGDDIFSTATSFADWIVPCLMLHKDGTVLREKGNFKGEISRGEGDIDIQVSTLKEQMNIVKEEREESFDPKLVDSIKNRMEYVYPFNALRNIEAKSSVTDIVHKAQGKEYDFSSLPGFMNKNGMTPTMRGTAVHKIMEFMDFKRAKEDFEGEIQRLVEWEYISEEEARTDIFHIKRFVESDLLHRMLKAEVLKREMKFITKMSAHLIKDDLPDQLKNEEIVVQGAVDCMFIEDNQVVIVDFKTDRVSTEKALIDSYKEQLDIYADACAKITGLKIKEKIIYSLVLDRAIVV